MKRGHSSSRSFRRGCRIPIPRLASPPVIRDKNRMLKSARTICAGSTRSLVSLKRSTVTMKPGDCHRAASKWLRLYCSSKSRIRHGRPEVPKAVKDLVRQPGQPALGSTTHSWRVVELKIEVSQATAVAKYMVRPENGLPKHGTPFLTNHAKDLVSADFFVVPRHVSVALRVRDPFP